MAWSGRESPWQSRVEVVLRAFAVYAAETDGTVRELLEGVAEELGGR